jgi:hypothetical protein
MRHCIATPMFDFCVTIINRASMLALVESSLHRHSPSFISVAPVDGAGGYRL